MFNHHASVLNKMKDHRLIYIYTGILRLVLFSSFKEHINLDRIVHLTQFLHYLPVESQATSFNTSKSNKLLCKQSISS